MSRRHEIDLFLPIPPPPPKRWADLTRREKTRIVLAAPLVVVWILGGLLDLIP